MRRLTTGMHEKEIHRIRTAPRGETSGERNHRQPAKPLSPSAFPAIQDVGESRYPVQEKAGQTAQWQAAPGRHQYLVAPTGRIRVNGVEAGPRDGIATKDEGVLTVEALEDAEIVLVDSR